MFEMSLKAPSQRAPTSWETVLDLLRWRNLASVKHDGRQQGWRNIWNHREKWLERNSRKTPIKEKHCQGPTEELMFSFLGHLFQKGRPVVHQHGAAWQWRAYASQRNVVNVVFVWWRSWSQYWGKYFPLQCLLVVTSPCSKWVCFIVWGDWCTTSWGIMETQASGHS